MLCRPKEKCLWEVVFPAVEHHWKHFYNCRKTVVCDYLFICHWVRWVALLTLVCRTLVWLITAAVQSPPHSVHSSLHTADDVDVAGERVLRETREDREQKARLRQIEDELARLTSCEVGEVPPLLLLLWFSFVTGYGDAGVCIAKVRATSCSLGTLETFFLLPSFIHARRAGARFTKKNLRKIPTFSLNSS